MKCIKCKKETNNPKFCSKSCSASYNNIGIRRHGIQKNRCKQCDNYVKHNPSIFCSSQCCTKYKFENSIKKWYAGEDISIKTIRKHLFEKNNNRCSKCGWSEINPYSNTKLPSLEVEHKDGKYKNNRPENLDLLCPNCHSLTPTYKALNIGNGRPYDKYR